MQNTPTAYGSDLFTILRTLKNQSKSRSVNNSLECSDLGPEGSKRLISPARAPPRKRLSSTGGPNVLIGLNMDSKPQYRLAHSHQPQ
jgi:hypothetical protein